MRQFIYLLLTGVFTLLLLGCNDEPPRYYPLQILVSQPLGKKSSDPLPDYIVQLALPYGKCGDVFLVPKPSLERLDVESSAISLETQIDPGAGGNKNNIRLIEKQTRANLEAMAIGEAYAKPAPEGVDLQTRYQTILAAKSTNSAVLVFSENFELNEYGGRRVYHDFDSLQIAIAQLVCEGGVTSVKVLFEPVMIQQEDIPKVNLNPAERPKLASNAIEVDNFTATIEQEGGSWEELYEKASRYILTEDEHPYGHPSAYCYVICATEKAIETGTTQKMYDRMSIDCPGKDMANDICRLKVGHEAFWNAVRAALLEKNSEELERLEEGLIDNWKKHLSSRN